jgi:hypothetical protein
MSKHDRHGIDQLALNDLQVGMAQTCSGDSHQDFPSARLFGLNRLDPQSPAGFGQNGGTESQRHQEITLNTQFSRPRSSLCFCHSEGDGGEGGHLKQFADETSGVPGERCVYRHGFDVRCGLLADRLSSRVISNCRWHSVNFERHAVSTGGETVPLAGGAVGLRGAQPH